MNKQLRGITMKFGGAFATLAMVTTSSIANSTCFWITYQEKMPKSAKKLRKF